MMQTKIFPALEALKKGEVIVYPTDTLYALGADIYNEKDTAGTSGLRHYFIWGE